MQVNPSIESAGASIVPSSGVWPKNIGSGDDHRHPAHSMAPRCASVRRRYRVGSPHRRQISGSASIREPSRACPVTRMPNPIGSRSSIGCHNIGSSALATTVDRAGSACAASARRRATLSGSPNRSSWSRTTLVRTNRSGWIFAATDGSAPSSTSKTAGAPPVPRPASAAATPRPRFAPLGFVSTSRPSAARIAASIAAVVVLPFVPDTIVVGCRRPRRRRNPGSSRSIRTPGALVLRPPRSIDSSRRGSGLPSR